MHSVVVGGKTVMRAFKHFKTGDILAVVKRAVFHCFADGKADALGFGIH